jgi:hypothetical protein
MANKKETTVKKPTEQNQKTEDNPIVYINLDRPRELRFGHSALKRMTSLTGKTMFDVTSDEFSLEELEVVLMCGLLKDAREHGETLELKDMENLLDYASSYMDIIDAMNQAMEQAFKQTKKQKN